MSENAREVLSLIQEYQIIINRFGYVQDSLKGYNKCKDND